jgi:hypothetical protein
MQTRSTTSESASTSKVVMISFLHYLALHYTTSLLHYTTSLLFYITSLHYTTLHYTALRCTKLVMLVLIVLTTAYLSICLLRAVYARAGDHMTAIAYMQQALVSNHSILANSYYNLGEVRCSCLLLAWCLSLSARLYSNLLDDIYLINVCNGCMCCVTMCWAGVPGDRAD